MWVEFVVGSFLCSERFFSGYSGFPLSSKTPQFDQESGRRRTTMWMCYLQIVIYLFIYLISSHVKITCYLYVKISPLLGLQNKSRLSHQKAIKVKWFCVPLLFHSRVAKIFFNTRREISYRRAAR